MLLYGASGHAKVIISCLTANSVAVAGVFDDDPIKTEVFKTPVLGKYNADFLPDSPLIVAIGYNNIRQKIAAQVSHRFGTVVHPSAIVDASVVVGSGTVVLHNAVVQADTVLGNHVIINTSASVDHDCHIGDFAHIAPNAVLCGSVSVGAGTLVGAGAVVAPNLRIGQNCLIAAGSVVTRHLPDNAIVRGNPARVIR